MFLRKPPPPRPKKISEKEARLNALMKIVDDKYNKAAQIISKMKHDTISELERMPVFAKVKKWKEFIAESERLDLDSRAHKHEISEKEQKEFTEISTLIGELSADTTKARASLDLLRRDVEASIKDVVAAGHEQSIDVAAPFDTLILAQKELAEQRNDEIKLLRLQSTLKTTVEEVKILYENLAAVDSDNKKFYDREIQAFSTDLDAFLVVSPAPTDMLVAIQKNQNLESELKIKILIATEIALYKKLALLQDENYDSEINKLRDQSYNVASFVEQSGGKQKIFMLTRALEAKINVLAEQIEQLQKVSKKSSAPQSEIKQESDEPVVRIKVNQAPETPAESAPRQKR